MAMTRWIAPEDSICLQIKYSDILESKKWPLSCFMRRAFTFTLDWVSVSLALLGRPPGQDAVNACFGNLLLLLFRSSSFSSPTA